MNENDEYRVFRESIRGQWNYILAVPHGNTGQYVLLIPGNIDLPEPIYILEDIPRGEEVVFNGLEVWMIELIVTYYRYYLNKNIIVTGAAAIKLAGTGRDDLFVGNVSFLFTDDMFKDTGDDVSWLFKYLNQPFVFPGNLGTRYIGITEKSRILYTSDDLSVHPHTMQWEIK